MNFVRVMNLVDLIGNDNSGKNTDTETVPLTSDQSKVCRACRTIDPALGFRSLRDPLVAYLFKSCASLEVTEADGLPESICSSCLRICKDCADFRNMCVQSVAYFTEKRSEGRILNKPEPVIEAYEPAEQIHSDDLDSVEIEENDTESGTAGESMDVTSNQTAKNTQIESHSPAEVKYPRFCMVCERTFETPELYDAYHSNGKESNRIRQKSTRKRKTICDICGEIVTNIDAHLTRHRPKTLECGLCTRKFVLESDLLRHRKRHSQEKTVKCDQCPSRFHTEWERRSHAKLIHPTELIECLPCGMQFKTRAYYKIHLLKHTDSRRFKCDQCDKRFFINANLKKHLLTHSEAKPFKCSLCPASFKSKGYLIGVHMKKEHPQE